MHSASDNKYNRNFMEQDIVYFGYSRVSKQLNHDANMSGCSPPIFASRFPSRWLKSIACGASIICKQFFDVRHIFGLNIAIKFSAA